MGLLDGPRGFNGTPPVALFDASHGQPNWSQTGFPSRQFHTNLAGLTEILCGLGYECRATNGEPLTQALTRAALLIIPPPTGRYDARRERWRPERSSCLTKAEVREVLRFLQAGGRMLAFAYRFGDSFTQTNLGDLCLALGCRLNDDAVIDVRALRQTDPLHLHFDTPCESLPRSWSRLGVRNVRWRPGATFTILPGTTAWPLALSTGGSCLSFNRTLRRISFDSLPIAIAGCHGVGRFALFGGPHLFESSSLGLLAEADNRRFLHNVLAWLHDTGVGVDPVAESPGEPMVVPDIRAFTRVEGSGNGERTVASVERVLRKTGVLKALSRAKWMP